MKLMIVIDVQDDEVKISGTAMGMSFPVCKSFHDNMAVARVHFPADVQASTALALTKVYDAAKNIGRVPDQID
jgi:hypothetical protein